MKTSTQKMPFVIFLTGPTASGKTALSLEIAKKNHVEIINADVAQFYEPLSVGVAKPDWKKKEPLHHLFDIVTKPVNFNVIKYRKLLLQKVQEIGDKNKIPLVVGGSLFYLKSIFFPPPEHYSNKKNLDFQTQLDNLSASELWKKLEEVDSERALQIHPNDIYRTKRALEIWFTTGIKPSKYKIKYKSEFDFLFIFLAPKKDLLFENINKRTIEMFNNGWIEEIKQLSNGDWMPFLCKKGFIGYYEIFKWIKEGEPRDKFPDIISMIQAETRQYAKRQLTFWKTFSKLLEKENSQISNICRTITLHSIGENVVEQISLTIKRLLKVREEIRKKE